MLSYSGSNIDGYLALELNYIGNIGITLLFFCEIELRGKIFQSIPSALLTQFDNNY